MQFFYLNINKSNKSNVSETKQNKLWLPVGLFPRCAVSSTCVFLGRVFSHLSGAQVDVGAAGGAAGSLGTVSQVKSTPEQRD